MSKKDPVASTPKPTKLALKKQTVRDLPPNASGADKVKGGMSARAVVEGDSRYCVAVC